MVTVRSYRYGVKQRRDRSHVLLALREDLVGRALRVSAAPQPFDPHAAKQDTLLRPESGGVETPGEP
jgi:hypothetical protein